MAVTPGCRPAEWSALLTVSEHVATTYPAWGRPLLRTCRSPFRRLVRPREVGALVVVGGSFVTQGRRDRAGRRRSLVNEVDCTAVTEHIAIWKRQSAL
jgi:hypothetical protein